MIFILYRNIFGEKAILAEILSQEDQDLVQPIMRAAEATTASPKLTFWFSGLKDEDDDGDWEWEHGKYGSSFQYKYNLYHQVDRPHTQTGALMQYQLMKASTAWSFSPLRTVLGAG